MRWGIIGCGDIAAKTALCFSHDPGETLAAVASRSLERAEAFAAEHGAARAYGDYDALLADPAVDVVYIATPHTHHADWACAALAAGKHVLCEKPMALNAAEVTRMIAAAHKHERFLMEAVWTRFLPCLTAVRDAIADGTIGDIRAVQADTGYRTPVWPDHRLYRLDLAGGGLMDIGVYGVSMVAWLLGRPDRVQSHAVIGETGVDEQAAMLLSYADGAYAQVTSAIRTATQNDLRITGTAGRIRVHAPFIRAAAYTLSRPGQPDETHDFSSQPADRRYLIPAVSDAIAAGRLEHPAMPLADSRITAEIMDHCRRQWGLRYPQEDPA